MKERVLKTKKEKLHFILGELNIPNIDIIQKTQLQSNVISEITNPDNLSRTLKNYHLFAIAFVYNIPIEIFDKDISSSSKIRELLRESKSKERVKSTRDLTENIKRLVGSWFIYFYVDNIKIRSKLINNMPTDREISFVEEKQITIDNDFNIKVKGKKRAKIEICSNQSIIILEDVDSKDTIVYTFDNDRVCYDRFFVSKISKTKHSKHEILNFGFFSKKRLQENEVQFILGDFVETQLRVNCNLLDRIGSYNDIENY